MAHLHITLKVPLEAGKQNLPLPRFKAIKHAWDGPVKVSSAEQNQLAMNEV